MSGGALIVDRVGNGCTIQDAGRPGWLRFGVPAGGAVDPLSLAIANRLVGNPIAAAAVEIGFDGAAFLVSGAPVAVAAMGGDATISIDRPMADGSFLEGGPLPAGRSAVAANGSRIRVSRPTAGPRTLLAVSGGIDVPMRLGSRATHTGAGIGGWEGRALVPGDRLPLRPPERLPPPHRLPRVEWPVAPACIRLLPGPQIDHFPPATVDRLVRTVWRVGSRADRMGIRLEGGRLSHNRLGADIVSDGIPLGAIQVPGDGSPILLLADRQPTGGYPKIAVAIGADLAFLAACRPGDPLRFAWTDVDTAEAAARERAAWIAGLDDRLVPVAEDRDAWGERLRGRVLLDGIAPRPAEAVVERAFDPDDDPPGVPGP